MIATVGVSSRVADWPMGGLFDAYAAPRRDHGGCLSRGNLTEKDVRPLPRHPKRRLSAHPARLTVASDANVVKTLGHKPRFRLLQAGSKARIRGVGLMGSVPGRTAFWRGSSGVCRSRAARRLVDEERRGVSRRRYRRPGGIESTCGEWQRRTGSGCFLGRGRSHVLPRIDRKITGRDVLRALIRAEMCQLLCVGTRAAWEPCTRVLAANHACQSGVQGPIRAGLSVHALSCPSPGSIPVG